MGPSAKAVRKPARRPGLSLHRARMTLPLIVVFVCAGEAAAAHAAEHITLRNGFDLICDHRASSGGTARLYLDQAGANYIDVQTADIVSVEAAPAAPQQTADAVVKPDSVGLSASEVLSPAALKEVLQSAGASHDLDIDLLASVVHAESSSHVHARSRAGAEGLMQLMPGTAAELGVHDVFAPGENVGGGTAYLDALLHRYHDNLAFALAAYNAGPAAVDRWHGVPPYRETRAYVARIIHEFNQRYAARQAAVSLASMTTGRVARP